MRIARPNLYVCYSLCQAIIGIFAFGALCKDTKNKELFDDAPRCEVDLIKKIAKQLGFSQKEIDKLQIKAPKENSPYSCRSFLNTVMLGQNTKNIEDFEARKFLYAHELAHIKYNHSVKMLVAFITLPVVTHVFAKICSKICKHLKFLDSSAIKIVLQFIILAFIRKKFEKDADQLAASLETKSTQAIIERWKLKKETGNIFRIFFGLHPLYKTRIRYLEAILKSQNPGP